MSAGRPARRAALLHLPTNTSVLFRGRSDIRRWSWFGWFRVLIAAAVGHCAMPSHAHALLPATGAEVSR